MPSSRSGMRRPSARSTRWPSESAGKCASASTSSSPCPIRHSVASSSGPIKGEIPISMVGAGRSIRSVVEQRLHVSRIDVGLVVPLEAGVDRLGDGLALDRLGGRLDTLVPDTDGILRDRTRHEAAANRVLLLLACVVSDHDHLALLLELLDGVDHPDGGALVGAEHALEVGVTLEHRLGQIRGFPVSYTHLTLPT